MATFIALAKNFSMSFFCNTKVAGLGEIFIQRKSNTSCNYSLIGLELNNIIIVIYILLSTEYTL